MLTIGRTALVCVGLIALLLTAGRIASELAGDERPATRLLLAATERTASGEETHWQFDICDTTTVFFEDKLSSLDALWAKIHARRGPLSHRGCACTSASRRRARAPC